MVASEFSDVFVSYRRKDVEFVKKLVQDLQNEGKEIWVDWEDIPPGVEGFADEIKRGLEGADAFIAVLSPDYLDSEYCVDMELRYAAEMNKRIIPIVIKTFEDYAVPSFIGHINWIYFIPHAGQSNTYDESFQKILDVLHTDLIHVRQHKQFLLRAVKWKENNRSNSFLITGDELQEAEQWLTAALGKEPLPTELHKDFIKQCRRVARQRQQMLFAGVVTALVISVILSIISLIGFNSATTNANAAGTAQFEAIANANTASAAQIKAQENEAKAIANAAAAETAQHNALENEARAESAQATAVKRALDADIRLLANQLNDIARSDPFRAYRLGLGLLEVENLPLRSKGEIIELFLQTGALLSFDYDVTDLQISKDRNDIYIASEFSIVQLDPKSGNIKQAYAHSEWVTAFDISEDGAFIVSADYNGSVYVWDTQSGELIDILDVLEFINLVIAVNIVEQDNTIMIAGQFGDVHLFSLETGEQVRQLADELEEEIMAVEFSPAHKYIVTISSDGQAILQDLQTGDIIYTFEGQYDPYFGSFEFASDETILITNVNNDGNAYVFDLISQEEIDEFTQIYDIDLSSDSTNIVTANWWGDIDFSDGDRFTNLNAYRVHFAPDGQSAIMIDADGIIQIVDVISGIITRTLGGNNGYSRYIEYLSDTTIMTGSFEQQIIWSTQNKEILKSLEAYPDSFFMLPDGQTAVQTIENGEIINIDLNSGDRIATIGQADDNINLFELSPSGKHLITRDLNSVVQLWDVELGELMKTFQHEEIGDLLAVAFSADGEYLLTTSWLNEFTVWHLPDLEVVSESIWNETYQTISRVALSAIGDTAYVSVFNDDLIHMIDLTDGKTLDTLTGHRSFINTIKLSADGTQMLSGADDNIVILWDTQSNSLIRQFEAHRGGITDVEFLPGGQSLLSTSTDDRMILWDVTSSEAIRIFDGHIDDVMSVDVATDGKTALTVSWDGTAKQWLLWFPNDDLVTWANENLQIGALDCGERAAYNLPNQC